MFPENARQITILRIFLYTFLIAIGLGFVLSRDRITVLWGLAFLTAFATLTFAHALFFLSDTLGSGPIQFRRKRSRFINFLGLSWLGCGFCSLILFVGAAALFSFLGAMEWLATSSSTSEIP